MSEARHIFNEKASSFQINEYAFLVNQLAWEKVSFISIKFSSHLDLQH